VVYAAFRGRTGQVNDLEQAALTAVPELRAWRKALDSCGGTHWQLSGSGSAYFAAHDAAAEAHADLARVKSAFRARELVPRGTWVTAVPGRGAEILQVV
jgi:4-diphosphocytidyl-2C-methyl-D-erythritol kinase